MSILWKILFLLLLLSCNEPEDLRSELDGLWAYNPDFAIGDTISQYFEDAFEPDTKPISEFEIRTDSGYYVHTYENSELLTVKERTALWIQEYEFVTDTSGILYFYDYDTAKTHDFPPKFQASSEEFTILKQLGKSIIRVEFDEPDRYMLIIRIMDGKMKLSDMGRTIDFQRIDEL